MKSLCSSIFSKAAAQAAFLFSTGVATSAASCATSHLCTSQHRGVTTGEPIHRVTLYDATPLQSGEPCCCLTILALATRHT